MNKKSLLLLIPFAAAALAGCEQANKKPDDPQPSQCESMVVSISKKTLDLKVNEKHTLAVTATPADCTLQGKWTSDRPDVASVNETTGEVTALAEGEANIKYGSYSDAVCKVTVTAGEEPIPVVHVEGIAFAQNEYEIEKDAELTLEVSVTPSNATNKNVSYALSDVSPDGAVSIDGNKVKGLIPGGQAKVTATSQDGGKTAQATIKVKSETPPPTPVHVTSVQFEKASYAVKVGRSIDVLATVLPENADEKGITYSLKDVSPEGCATISNNTVSGVAEGTAIIVATAKDNGKTGEATVTISADPQPVHKGTADDPYDADDAILVAESLDSKSATKDSFYIEDVVTEIVEAPSAQYKNYTFMFGEFKCFRLMKGPNSQEFSEGDIEVGDTVVVYSQIQKYGDHDELETKGGYVVEVKKPGEGTPVSIKEVVSGPLSVEQGDVLKASDYVIALNMSTGNPKNVTPTGISVDTSVVGDEIPLTLEYTGLEPLTIKIEVKKPADKVVGDFYKVKNNAEITEGKYILVYEGGETAKVFNGLDAVNDGVDATASSGHIAANDNLVQVELESEGSGFALKVLSGTNAGKYIYNSDKSKAYMGFDASKKEHAVSLNEDGSIRIQDKNSEKALRYNSASDQQRFRYYAVDGQKPINLYKMHEGEPAELVSISVDSSQVKKEYYVGDSLDTTNLVVTAHYDDSSEKVITSGYTIDPESFEEAGDNVAVTISYNGKNAEPFNVKVNEARTISTVTIVDYPEEITEGDEITAEDVLVDVIYSVGDPDEDVHPESVLLGEVLDGKADLTATVGDVTSEAVKVTVKAKEVYTPVTLSKDDAVLGSDAKFNEIAGVKLGTGSAAGSINLTLPKGTNKLSFYAVGWKDTETKVTLSGIGEDRVIDLVSDAGLSGNSPFTLTQDLETFHILINLDAPLAVQTKITIAATTGNRFGIWDAGVKTEEIHVTKVEIVAYPDSIYVGDILTEEDILVDVTYDKAPKQEGVNPDSFTLDTSKAGTAQLTATVGDITSDPIDVEILEERYVTGVTIVDYPKEITEGDEISVLDILVDVTYSVGEDSKGIHPDSYSLSVPVGGKASLTAAVDDVTSDAVEVTVKKADVLTPIELSTKGGTNAEKCVVQISEEDPHNGIKCGSSKNAGTMQMVLPEGATKVVFYAAGWAGSTATLSVTGLGDEKTFNLQANSGLTGNSPFTFSGVEDFSSFKIVIELDTPLESETTITLAAGKIRFAVWDAAVVIDQKTVTGIEITDWPKSVEQDAVIAKEDVKVTLTYDDGTSKTDATPDSISCDTSKIGTAKLTATAGEVTSAEVDVTVTEPVTVTSVQITDYPESVSQNASIEAKDVKVTVSYSNGSSEDDVTPDSVACDTSKIGTAQLTATFEDVTSDPVDVTVTAAQTKTATIAYSGSSTGNMDGTNQASALGVTDTAVSVVGSKINGGSNNVGLNKDGTMRLYKGSTCQLEISVSSGSIEKIEVTFGTTVGNLIANGNAVDDVAASATVTIAVGGNSVILTNSNSASQTWIASIVIYYSL